MRINMEEDIQKEYPATPECEMNEKECEFTPIEFVCHDCGKKLCVECAVGIKHQPQFNKYKFTTDTGDETESIVHCPECAEKHSYNKGILALGGSILAIGLISFVFQSMAGFIVGAILALIGTSLGIREYDLKRERDPVPRIS